MPYRTTEPVAPEAPRSPWGSRRAVAVGALVAVTGVVAGARHARRREPPQEVHRAVPFTLPGGFHESAWRVRAPRLLEPEEVIDHHVRVLMGAPSSSGSDMVRVAPMRTASPILGATPVEHGWVFVTLDGRVARSDDFLGALHEMGRMPCPFRVERASQGRAAVLDAQGALWTTTGQGPFARVAGLSQVRAAAFVDARSGAAVLRDGSLWITRDHAATWQRDELHGEVAWGFTRHRDELYVAMSKGARRLDADGALQDRAFFEPDDMSIQDRERVRAAIDPSQVPTWFRAASTGRCAELAPATHPAEVPALPALDLACRVEGSCAVPSMAISRGRATPPGGTAARTSFAFELDEVRATGWRDGADSLDSHAHLAWRGEDRSGAFASATSASAAWPECSTCRMSATIFDSGAMLDGLIGTRRGLLVRWQPTHLRVDDQLLWARAGGTIVRVSERGEDVTLHASATASLSMTQPDGGVWVAFIHTIRVSDSGSSLGFPHERLVVALALDIDPDGVVRGRRAVLDDEAHFVGLARWDRRVGPLLRGARDNRAGVIVPIDGGAPVAVPWLLPYETRPCGDARPAAEGFTLVHRVSFAAHLVGADDGHENEVRGRPVPSGAQTEVLEVGPEGACTRALSVRYRGRPREDILPLSLRARGGSMWEGCYDDDSQRPARILCHAETR